MKHEKRRFLSQNRLKIAENYGARDRTWTDTDFTPRDFKAAQQALSQHIVYFIANKAQYIVVSVGCPQTSEST